MQLDPNALEAAATVLAKMWPDAFAHGPNEDQANTFAIETARRILLAASHSRPAEAKVKPLEWDEGMVEGRMVRRGFGSFGTFAYFEIARLTEAEIRTKEAAAQADYEARIRSALEPAEAKAEPVAVVSEQGSVLFTDAGAEWFKQAIAQAKADRSIPYGKPAILLYAFPCPPLTDRAAVIEAERKRAVAAIHWVFSADGTKGERSLAAEAIDKINDPTFLPALNAGSE